MAGERSIGNAVSAPSFFVVLAAALIISGCCGPWDGEAHMPTGVVAPPPRMMVANLPPPKAASSKRNVKTASTAARQPAVTKASATEAPADAADATQKSAAAEPAAGRAETPPSTVEANIAKLAKDLAAELSARCPFSGAGDEAAFGDCKTALGANSKLRTSLATTPFWGAVTKDSGRLLLLSGLAPLTPDELAARYLPLFTFSGRSDVSFVASDQFYRIELGARFRNRLPAKHYPDAVVDKDDAWAAYQGANAIVLWVDPRKQEIRVIQFRPGSIVGSAPSVPADRPRP